KPEAETAPKKPETEVVPSQPETEVAPAEPPVAKPAPAPAPSQPEAETVPAETDVVKPETETVPAESEVVPVEPPVVQPEVSYVPEDTYQKNNVVQEQVVAKPSVSEITNPPHATYANTIIAESTVKKSAPVENKTVVKHEVVDSHASEEVSTDADNKEIEESAKETDEKISDIESKKPKAQERASGENQSSGNGWGTLIWSVLGALTLTGAAATGMAVMRHRRNTRA
ncbi:hypothetical protein HMPREF3208_01238, partial [Gardnerella vaginalis]